ncbi:ATP-binding protein [Propioniciclava sp.]|uniref:ATP-binding protein n=1 Tax=Propioniciclava sp. TaxID=2038686 RepID=UPI00262038CB|nr:ATP-binding protein [Propioniciclava sp.]
MTQAELAAPGEPRRLARRVDRAWLGGVCAGLAEHLGLAPVLVRALFVTVAAWKLVGVGLYLLFWLALPPIEEAHDAPGLDAHSRRGMRTVDSLAVPRGVDLGQGIALALLAAGLLWLVQQIGWGLPAWWLIAGLAAASGLGLIWYQADRIVPTRGESDGWGRWVAPVAAHWSSVMALASGLVLLGLSVAAAAFAMPQLGTVGALTAIVGCVVVLLGLVAAPWALRVRRALGRAREAKLLSDARADMAAHLHDSVLQTLALIQRQASDPRAVVRLARRQERQLRQWLYGAPADAETLGDALREAAQAVEDDFPVSVECVLVGDAPLTPGLAELVKAAREAMVNAAKHSGAPDVDVYAEVADDTVEVFIRDRGRGFDPDAVADDRMGVRGSILERMTRHHGVARIRSDAERGTEVSLEMRR